MGRDNHPKSRRARQLQRKRAARASYDRFLIVCEGSKTEPLYFREIQAYYRLHSANVQITPGKLGTDPLNVVKYAEQLFIDGDPSTNVSRRAFEHVYAIIDRDEHNNYHDALDKAESLNKKLRNDLKSPVTFKALASVPCFELWLLLHYEDITHPISRQDALSSLKTHLPNYEKGQGGHYTASRDYIEPAISRAKSLSDIRNAHDDHGPFSSVYELIELLQNLRPNKT